jgi:hypothetical protein
MKQARRYGWAKAERVKALYEPLWRFLLLSNNNHIGEFRFGDRKAPIKKSI